MGLQELWWWCAEWFLSSRYISMARSQLLYLGNFASEFWLLYNENEWRCYIVCVEYLYWMLITNFYILFHFTGFGSLGLMTSVLVRLIPLWTFHFSQFLGICFWFLFRVLQWFSCSIYKESNNRFWGPSFVFVYNLKITNRALELNMFSLTVMWPVFGVMSILNFQWGK